MIRADILLVLLLAILALLIPLLMLPKQDKWDALPWKIEYSEPSIIERTTP